MGTFLGMYECGNFASDEKRDEFVSRVQRILDLTGMMQLSKVSMFGKNVYSVACTKQRMGLSSTPI